MESGGTTIFDEGQGGTSVTKTFDTQWNNKDLYWGVRTANPLSPNWSVRHFRIEPSTPSCSPGSSQVSLYVDANYGGQCVTKDIGNYSNPSAIGLPNDSISSIRVGGSVQAVLCGNDDYGGTCETFTGDDSNLSDNSIGDNQVSSAQVQIRSGTTETRLYDNTNYGGSSAYVTSTGLYSAGSFNDMAESITMPNGWSVRLFQNDDYYGPQVCIQGNDSNLWDNYYNNGNVAANSATWLEVYSQSTCPAMPPSTPGNFHVSGTTQNSITLAWDDVENETGYRIYEWNGENFYLTHSLGANTTSFTDTGLSCNVEYFYELSAYNKTRGSQLMQGGYPEPRVLATTQFPLSPPSARPRPPLAASPSP